jgi:N-acetylglucosamine-6-phosphate deacetylase
VSLLLPLKSKHPLDGPEGLTESSSSITLLECVNNFLAWTGHSIPQALRAVTATPAAMLGLEGVKGTLAPGADADLMILTDQEGGRGLKLNEVWKFGCRVSRSD